ncbi:hypothetical protein diail_4106 [Diaporthe ilicicola]|nr:hypothetical protein diail_4106 [Diaporthe ilicicola]
MRPQYPLLAAVSAAEASLPGAASYVVPTAFPTSVYSSYYVQPGPTQEPQPAIYDPVLNITFPLNLTDPSTIPTEDLDPVLYPVAAANLSDVASAAIISAAVTEVLGIISANNTGLADSCSKCVAALSVAKFAASLAPAHVPDALVALCQATGFSSKSACQNTYEAGSFGAVWTQVLAKADFAGLDGRYICSSLSTKFCSAPPVISVKATFPKEKPDGVSVPARSGKRAKVFHLSDMHLDPRYEAGTEGDCTSSPCCRPSSALSNGSLLAVEIPAPLYGWFRCDSPYYLALAALQSIGPLTGTSQDDPPAMTFYTGDMVTHAPSQVQLSQAFVEDVEDSLLQMFKAYIGGPIYAALGNHDSSPENNDAPHAIDNNGPLGEQFSWNYDHISQLWEHYGWINSSTQAEAAVHYGAYAVTHPLGVRIITLNSDFYYKSNYYAFLHIADPDYSGIFTFLIDELQKAEDAGQRAYVVAHVLTGWDGTNPTPGGSDYFYQIVERYSPHVIAGVFFGHTHEDQAFIYYSNNGTNQSAENAVANAWVGPSLTPLTNLNSGYRMYEIDTGSFEVMEAYTFYSDVSKFSSLEGSGPTWEFEYSTREAYGTAAGWGENEPLNATFWHRVTEAMEKDRSLVSLQNTYQGKSSVMSPNCTNQACAEARICYMRSGSKSSRLPRPLVQAGDSTVRLRKAETDDSVEVGHVPRPQTTQLNGSKGCGETSAASAVGPTTVSRNPPWNAYERYWSDRNSFPDYGKPEGAKMGRSLKDIGKFFYGDLLNGRSSQTEAPATTPKRVRESSLDNPAKRRRIEDDARHDVHIIPSSPELPERSVAASSGQRKGAQDGQDALSLRSSADRSANGKTVEEYRSAQHRGGLGTTSRSRRRPQARRPSGGIVDDDSEIHTQKMTSSAPFKSRNSLLQLQKPTNDPIQDDEDPVVTAGPVARASVINGRPSAKTAAAKAAYTDSRLLDGGCGSEDELSMDQPIQARGAFKKTTVLVSQQMDGRKRQIENQIDDKSQTTSLAKRRTQPSDRTNIHRMTLGSEVAQIGGDRGRLRVTKAVCEPRYAYPAKGSMPRDAKGASDRPCVLVPTKEGGSLFEAVDAVTGETIPDLVWLTPTLSKVTKIFHARNSMIVKILKSSNGTHPLNTGAVLFIQFGNGHLAERFVSRCCSVIDTIARVTMDIVALAKEMDHKGERIEAFNKTGKAPDTDVQYLEHKESTSNQAKPKPSAQSAGLNPKHSQQAADERPLRVQMKGDSPVLAEGKATSVQEATSMTPEQEKQIRENFGDDSQSECQPRRNVRNDKKLQTSSRIGTYEPELRSQRNLRSAGPKPQSPSPVIDRWTANHPDWAAGWRIDLVYERTVIGKSDVERLDEGQLLNDEIITLYLKYLHKQLENTDEQLAKKVYFFNSFFWEKLRSKRGMVNYEGVKNWTAKVDLLSFDYIIVPINEHAHWYVAIICNAKGLLSPHATSETDEHGSDKPQDQADAVAEDDVAETPASDTMKKIAVDVSHISIDDESAEIVSDYQDEHRKAAAAKKPKAPRKGSIRKYDPKAPIVITFDSLGGTHSAVNTALKTYLQHEIEAKKGLRVEASGNFGTSAKDIPTQPNFTDCGVYLLGYMREFMKDPHRFVKNILQREPRDWDVEAPTLRNEIRELIFKMQKDYQRDQEHRRRERAQAKRQKQKPQGLAVASEIPSRSSVESPVRESPAPLSSSAANSRQVTPLLAERSHLRAAINHDVRVAHVEDDVPQPAAVDRHDEVGQTRPSHRQSQQTDTPANVNNDVNNASMIVNVDESIEGAEAHSFSVASASKPVESIELESDGEVPKSSATRETPSAREIPQSTITQTATPAKIFDERRFLAPIPSSSASSSPVKAAPVKNKTSRENLVGVKGSGDKGNFTSSPLDGGHARRYGAAKGRVTKSEVIPSSSDEEGGATKGKKRESPTIDLTLE